jgi:hypothetical protein
MGIDSSSAYVTIPGFEHVLIEESWLLSVEADDTSARMEVDLVLLPGHPDHTPSKPGEQYCHVGGTISFTSADAVVLDLSGRPPAVGADGTLHLDNIDQWDTDDGHHHLSGSWGDLDVWGGDVRIAVDFPANYRIEFLPGLPGTGPLPIAFNGPDDSGIQEGRVVEVHTGRATSWVGNIQQWWRDGPDLVLRTPNPDRFVLVVGARAWYVDVLHPERFEILDGRVYGGASLIRQGLLLVEGESFSCAIDRDGVRWSTRDRDFLPYYGPVTMIEADDEEAEVELLDTYTDRPCRLRISLADGHLIVG